MAQPTLLDIARNLGVSKVSVSLGLRELPGVSAPLRARIQAEARRLGYRPNPVAAELMSIVRSRRRKSGAETIAFINTFREPRLFAGVRGLPDFVRGARRRAELYGYRLEEFAAFGHGMTPERLARVLFARGIRGVLLGPRWLDEPEIELPWDRHACVLVGEPRHGADLCRVCNHHMHAASLGLRKLAELGHRRIALVLLRRYECVRGFDYLAGLEEARQLARAGTTFLTYFADGWNEAKLTRWVRREKPDAVLSLIPEVGDLLKRLAEAGRPAVQFADLNVNPRSGIAGVNQHSEDIGGSAVDLLRSLLHSGEHGLRVQPRLVLIEGSWEEGAPQDTLHLGGPPSRRARGRVGRSRKS